MPRTQAQELDEIRNKLGGALTGELHITFPEIRQAIHARDWQIHRASMKGRPTLVKLDMLCDWLDKMGDSRTTWVQITNYINALKRGGQLSTRGYIQR